MAVPMPTSLLDDVKALPLRPTILVPYVDGMIRPETTEAVTRYNATQVFYPLDPAEDGAYGRVLDQFWDIGGDLLVIEQDMVPTHYQIASILACPEPWCTTPYHYGDGRYIASLGFAKFSHDLRQAHPAAAILASRDNKGVAYRAHWKSISENLARQLTRWHVPQHQHEGHVTHLHFPEADDA
jgi:hypothetical protein